jgi:hypothetical protein
MDVLVSTVHIPVSFSCALFPSIKLMEMLLAISSCGRMNNLMRNAIDFSKLEQGYSERNLRLSLESRFPPPSVNIGGHYLLLYIERRKTWRQLRKVDILATVATFLVSD